MDDAWLMLLQPHSEPVTREVTGQHEGGGDGDIQAPTKWSKLVAGFHDVFNPPGMPVSKIPCIKLSYYPMLSLTTDISTECLQLNQQR